MREKILLRRRVAPKRVTLRKGQSLVARYERVSRKNLPRYITVKKVQKIGPRQRRRTQKVEVLENIVKLGAKLGASGFEKGLFRKGFSADTKALSSDLGQKLINEGIKQAPNLYRIGTSKIKNKNVRKALESDVANYLVEEVQKKAKKILIIYLVGCKK